MSKKPPVPPEMDEPLVIDLEAELNDKLGEEVKVAVGVITDPTTFEVGIVSSLDDALVLYFAPPEEGFPPHALAFNGAAADKLLRAFYALLQLSGMIGDMEESPEQPRKKVTLH